MLMLVPVCAVAQNQKAPSATKHIGILYLETVEELTSDCGQKSTYDSDCMSRWESSMTSIEDRVDIALSESRRRSSGDAPYWDLLKSVKYANKCYVMVDRDQQKAWSDAYIKCKVQTHAIALEGEYDGDGGCGTAIVAATHQ